MAISAVFRERFTELCDEMEEIRHVRRAEAIGISNTTYSNAHNYGILPKVPALIRIADHFGVSVAYLIGESDRETFSPTGVRVSFQDRLKQLRKERGLTVYELGNRTHIHRNNIAQWMKQGYFPLLDDLVLLASFFDVSLDYLLGRTDDRESM